MDINNRIKYYMGNCINKVTVKNNPDYEKNAINMKCNQILALSYDKLKKNKRNNRMMFQYIGPLMDILKNKSNKIKCQKFLHIWGDVNSSYNINGIISKSKVIGDDTIVLFKMSEYAHWVPINTLKKGNIDIKYINKLNAVVWRGVTTGTIDRKGSRFALVERYFDKNPDINIGFSKIVQNKKEYSQYVKNQLNYKSQLKYKFIISVEGNDVASGLKWQLYSNSVVMMAKPTICSWAMEDKLEPYVHYIPLLDDYSDLEQQFKWGLENEKKCIEISKNATQYIEQFLDYEKENIIKNEIITKYMENVTVSENY